MRSSEDSPGNEASRTSANVWWRASWRGWFRSAHGRRQCRRGDGWRGPVRRAQGSASTCLRWQVKPVLTGGYEVLRCACDGW